MLAGYRQDRNTLRVAFSDEVEDSELIFWTSPSGDVITEKQAIARIEQEKEKD